MSDRTKFGFVCVQNAGRSQMSAAFANRERHRRGLADEVEILTGGTDPADDVHPEVLEVMQDVDIDIALQEPRRISTEELNACDVVITMGCSTLEVDADVEVRDWDLEDPHGKDIETVREIREEVEQLVGNLFNEYFLETQA